MTDRLHSTVWGPCTRLHLRWTDADRTLCGRRVGHPRRPWPIQPCARCRQAYDGLDPTQVHVDWVWQRSTSRHGPASP